MRFRAVLELHGKTATGFVVPEDVVAALGSGKRPAVTVTVHEYTYRSTVAVMGGRYLVGVSADVRARAGIAAGDEVDVELELDTAPREVSVPDDFAAALEEAGVRSVFDRMSYSHRREHVRAIEDAKKVETRERRIAGAIEMIRRAR